MRPALYDVDPEAWGRLRDEVRQRAREVCEYCGIAPVRDIHHRYGYGAETVDCLMAMCRPCHSFIEGKSAMRPQAAAGSLARLGDPGFGTNPIWRAYLARSR